MAIELLRRRPVSELQPGKAALRLITTFEGLSLKSYRDSVGILTAGYGHTGPDVLEDMQITLKQADDWLAEDMAEAWGIVQNAVTVPLTQGEADALTSLAFNLGKIPRSMLACLNGGTTDKGEVMAPGSYGSALKQFPRSCRAGGIPLRGLYRRRLAEACVFSDLPYENACSLTVVQLEIDSANNIVPSGTTSLEDTLMRARQDIPILKPDTSSVLNKPWDELVLDKPVPPPAPTAKPDTGTAPAKASQPEPVQLPLPNTGSSKPASRPAPGSVAPPPSPSGAGASTLPPPKPVVIAPQPINPNALPTNADTSKNMADSTRMLGMVLVAIGSVIQVVTLRLGIGTAVGAVFFDLSRDPVVITLTVTSIIAAMGWVTKRNGKKTFKKGVEKAQGGLY